MLDQNFKVYDVLNLTMPHQELLEEIVKGIDIKKVDLLWFDYVSEVSNKNRG